MNDKTLLVGDVGGTNARFAVARMVDGKPVLDHHESFPAERYPTFLKGVAAFIDVVIVVVAVLVTVVIVAAAAIVALPFSHSRPLSGTSRRCSGNSRGAAAWSVESILCCRFCVRKSVFYLLKKKCAVSASNGPFFLTRAETGARN